MANTQTSEPIFYETLAAQVGATPAEAKEHFDLVADTSVHDLVNEFLDEYK